MKLKAEMGFLCSLGNYDKELDEVVVVKGKIPWEYDKDGLRSVLEQVAESMQTGRSTNYGRYGKSPAIDMAKAAKFAMSYGSGPNMQNIPREPKKEKASWEKNYWDDGPWKKCVTTWTSELKVDDQFYMEWPGKKKTNKPPPDLHHQVQVIAEYPEGYSYRATCAYCTYVCPLSDPPGSAWTFPVHSIGLQTGAPRCKGSNQHIGEVKLECPYCAYKFDSKLSNDCKEAKLPYHLDHYGVTCEGSECPIPIYRSY